MHVPVTVRFLDYVFNEIHTYVLFSRMGCFPDAPFLWQTQKLKNSSLLSLAQFSVLCAINRAGQLICLLASLHERDRAGLIDKPALKSKV